MAHLKMICDYCCLHSRWMWLTHSTDVPKSISSEMLGSTKDSYHHMSNNTSQAGSADALLAPPGHDECPTHFCVRIAWQPTLQTDSFSLDFVIEVVVSSNFLKQKSETATVV